MTPSRASPPIVARKVTISGVVSPVDSDSSLVVTPSVPIDAARIPLVRQIWRTISAVEVLPLVPVTATIVAGAGAKNPAASRANARRGSAAMMCTAPSTTADGRATTATAPDAMAAAIKSSPLNRVPGNAPNTVPGATLRWSMAKPVTSVPGSATLGSAIPAATASAPSFIPARSPEPAARGRKYPHRGSRRA